MTLVQPTVEMQQHIRSELNEDVSTRDKDLEHIKEWLRMQPHLPQFQGESTHTLCMVLFDRSASLQVAWLDTICFQTKRLFKIYENTIHRVTV